MRTLLVVAALCAAGSLFAQAGFGPPAFAQDPDKTGNYIGLYKLSELKETFDPALAPYIDYSGVHAPWELLRGFTYEIGLEGGSYPHGCIVGWIDFNQNDAFAADEMIGQGVHYGGNGSASFSFEVPANAAAGVTRMRLLEIRALTPYWPADPVGSYDAGQCLDFEVEIIVAGNPEPHLFFFAMESTTFEVGDVIGETIEAVGGTGALTFSATGLPTGLTIGAVNGVLGGTATSAMIGTHDVTVTVTDSTAATDTLNFELLIVPDGSLIPVVNDVTVIAPAALPNAIEGQPYSFTLTATGGIPGYRWRESGLPAWAALDTSTGQITGTPQTGDAGSALVTIACWDTGDMTNGVPPTFDIDNLSLTTITPTGGLPLDITTTSLPNGAELAAYSTVLQATGGTVPYTWDVTGLPTWATLNQSTGEISGTPTAGSATTSNLVVTVTDNAVPADTDVVNLTLTISGTTFAITTTSLPAATELQAYSHTLTAGGGTGALTWIATNLPTWLSLGASNGQLTGTPPIGAEGTHQFQVGVTDSSTPQKFASKSFILVVQPVPAANPNAGLGGKGSGGCTLNSTRDGGPASFAGLLAFALAGLALTGGGAWRLLRPLCALTRRRRAFHP